MHDVTRIDTWLLAGISLLIAACMIVHWILQWREDRWSLVAQLNAMRQERDELALDLAAAKKQKKALKAHLQRLSDERVEEVEAQYKKEIEALTEKNKILESILNQKWTEATNGH